MEVACASVDDSGRRRDGMSMDPDARQRGCWVTYFPAPRAGSAPPVLLFVCPP